VRCGRIVEGSYTDMLQGLRDVVVVDRGMCGVHGDSGSPVFDGPTAMGIFSGVLVDPLDPDEECTEAVFHKLAHVEADTGAYVILEPR
jgi:hypothetical protein